MPDVTECQVIQRRFVVSEQEIETALRKAYPQIPKGAAFSLGEMDAEFRWETVTTGVVKD